MDKFIKNVFQSKLLINIKIKCKVKMRDFNSKCIFYYSKILLNFPQSSHSNHKFTVQEIIS